MAGTITALCSQVWSTPPCLPELTEDCIHIWWARLDAPGLLHRNECCLSPDEKTRAERFHTARDHLTYVTSRGILRKLLAGYLQLDASGLQFEYGAQGKPRLAAGRSQPALYFNLSHSHHGAIYAVTRGGEVGVDLEYIRPLADMGRIAERFFSAREISAFRDLPSEEQVDAFFACWTRKEAFLKAVGGGLSLPLDSFDVSLLPGEPDTPLQVLRDPNGLRRWSLYGLQPRTGFIAALAAEGTHHSLHCYVWPPPGFSATE